MCLHSNISLSSTAWILCLMTWVVLSHYSGKHTRERMEYMGSVCWVILGQTEIWGVRINKTKFLAESSLENVCVWLIFLLPYNIQWLPGGPQCTWHSGHQLQCHSGMSWWCLLFLMGTDTHCPPCRGCLWRSWHLCHWWASSGWWPNTQRWFQNCHPCSPPAGVCTETTGGQQRSLSSCPPCPSWFSSPCNCNCNVLDFILLIQ